MTDTKALQTEAQRGEAAQALRDNQLFVDSIGLVKDRYLQMWKTTSPDDVQTRERCFIAMSVAEEFFNELNVIIANGAMARSSLKKAQR